MTDREKILHGIIELALAAGLKVMEIYESDFDVEEKDDNSPVTLADKLGEELILGGLKKLAPGIPVIAEEAASEGNIPDVKNIFFLVDPLDGTKEFVKKTGEFTVNIALIEDGEPILGVVYAPAIAKLYYGAKGSGAYLQNIKPDEDISEAPEPELITTRTPPAEGWTAFVSKSHRTPETDEYMEAFNIAEYKAAGSSLKFCLVATGEADLYPRLGRTMEWDTAAGHAVVLAAGGRVIDLDTNEPLLYGKKERGYDNPHFSVFGK